SRGARVGNSRTSRSREDLYSIFVGASAAGKSDAVRLSTCRSGCAVIESSGCYARNRSQGTEDNLGGSVGRSHQRSSATLEAAKETFEYRAGFGHVWKHGRRSQNAERESRRKATRPASG